MSGLVLVLYVEGFVLCFCAMVKVAPRTSMLSNVLTALGWPLAVPLGLALAVWLGRGRSS